MIRGKAFDAAIVLLLVLAIISVAIAVFGVSAPLLYYTLLGNTADSPPGPRLLANSRNFGGGDCQWMPPTYDVPEEIDFHKTIITGFPSGDKRMVFLQMEGLAGWPAKDEWDFAFLGMSNHPFIKANYPHHEGIWGWETVADQVILVIPNIRRSMVEYHDIVWDLGYATTWKDATVLSNNLFEGRPHLDEFHMWRDSRVMDEARWYGWLIDYWMEGGLQRDIFTHKIITHEHWQDLMNKPFYAREELNYDNYVANGTIIEPSYDPHCVNGDITNGCEPVAVVSVDTLRDDTQGQTETTVIGNSLLLDARTGRYVIGEETWACIWEELIVNRKGPKTIDDRPGVTEYGYNFAVELLEEMLFELNRLISKYSQTPWITVATANRLVAILIEHRATIQIEINEVNSGMRVLQDGDFLGPTERIKRRDLRRGKDTESNAVLEKEYNSKRIRKKDPKGETDTEPNTIPKRDYNQRYFSDLEQKRFEHKRNEMRRFTSMRDRRANPEQEMSNKEMIEASNTLAKIRAAGRLNSDQP